METTALIGIIIGICWVWRCAYEFGHGSGTLDQSQETARQIEQVMAQELPPQPLVQDRPLEQAGFVMLHENFIDNPPEDQVTK